MLEAMRSIYSLRWTQRPQIRPLPSAISRSFIDTPGGELEFLAAKPKQGDLDAPSIFFVHGGCGHASVWLEWMTFLREAGYGGSLYCYSARSHGASYAIPYLRMVYGTSINDLAGDLAACVHAAQEMEGGRNLVLVGHSSGGGLVQYALARRLVKCRALCLLDAVPHFGNFCMYANWARHDPWFLLRSLLHFQHPNSPLSSTSLIHGAFFCSRFPMSSAQEFARWMPAYESMGWPMGMGGSFWAWLRGQPRWLDPSDLLCSVSSAREVEKGDCVCIMVGSEDMMLDATIWEKQATELARGMRRLQTNKEPTKVENVDGVMMRSEAGVQLVVVHGSGHHLQNDLQHHVGAQALLRFARQC